MLHNATLQTQALKALKEAEELRLRNEKILLNKETLEAERARKAGEAKHETDRLSRQRKIAENVS